MVGAEGNLLLRIAFFGHVHVDRDAAAGRERRADHGDDASVVQFLLGDARRRMGCRGERIGDEVVGIDWGRPGPDAVLQNGSKRSARLGELGTKAIHRRIVGIADDQALLAVEHAEPLRHALESGG